MFSETPGTPGRRQQMPRTLRSTCTPACEASYSAWMQAASTSEFIFSAIRASSPARWASTVASISSTMRSRIVVGATSTLRYSAGRP